MIMRLIHVAHLACPLQKILREPRIIQWNACAYLNMDVAFVQPELTLRQHAPYPMQEYRQDLCLQLLCQIERTLVEAQDPAVFRTCAFGEDTDGIAALIEVAQTLHMVLDAIAHGIELCLVDHHPIEGIVPHPSRW